MGNIEKLIELPEIGTIIREKNDFQGSSLKIYNKEIKPIPAFISVEGPVDEVIYKKLKFDSSNFLSSREFPILALGKIEDDFLAYAKYLELNEQSVINEICLLDIANINDYYEFPNIPVSIM